MVIKNQYRFLIPKQNDILEKLQEKEESRLLSIQNYSLKNSILTNKNDNNNDNKNDSENENDSRNTNNNNNNEKEKPPIHYRIAMGMLSSSSLICHRRRKLMREFFRKQEEKLKQKLVKYVFVMTNDAIEKTPETIKESEKYGDIIFRDAPFGFDSVVYKTKAGIDYFMEKYYTGEITFDYFMKTDDDAIIDIEKLVSEATNVGSSDFYNIGTFNNFNSPSLEPHKK
jgi:hypothetical protein